MGRSSSTGYPFLVQRPDAGQFTYHRVVSAALAPCVVGDVQLHWTGRTRTLQGKSTIKISLGTGDKKTARQRWSLVHAQVDPLIQMAELRARDQKDPDQTSDMPRIDPAHIRKIAEQAYHDVLATDDRGHIEPGFVTPLASILMRLGRKALVGGANSATIAERVARHAERGALNEQLRVRKSCLLDRPIKESELPGSIIDEFPTTFARGDRLAPELVEALANGISIGEIPSEVEQRLQENGLHLPKDHLDRRAIALAITRAKLRALQDVKKRDGGDPIDTPDRPETLKQSEPKTTKVAPRLSEMQGVWMKLARPADKQVGDNTRYMRLFISLHGDLPVTDITGAHVRAFRDALLDCPRNPPQHLAKASVKELISWAQAHPGDLLSRETINHKGIGSLSTLLEQARRNEHITINPAAGQQLPTRMADRIQRRPYKVEELNRVFTTCVYQDRPSIPVGGRRWAAWWLPILSLFTGARLEELGQACVGDVKQDHGVNFIEITTVSDDEDDLSVKVDKTLKSFAARRRIPLHSVLIDLGLLDYVSFLKSKTATRLFPDLDEYRGRYTKNFSRWWGRWLEKHEMGDESLTFHSFRHTFIAELRRLKCEPGIIKEVVGHAQTDVTSNYGRTDNFLYDLGDVHEQIQRIEFKGVELDRIYGKNTWRCDSL